jgi:signal transduction histidine kinase
LWRCTDPGYSKKIFINLPFINLLFIILLFTNLLFTNLLFTNLLGNALKFTEDGAITLTGVLKASGDVGTLSIAIKDEGIGIQNEDFKITFFALEPVD